MIDLTVLFSKIRVALLLLFLFSTKISSFCKTLKY